jgi:sialate O-acetylesterase
MRYYLFISIFFFSCYEKTNSLSLSDIFSDGMVLQRKSKISIWGKSQPKQLVIVVSSWDNQSSSISDNNGNWVVELQTKDAGGPHSLEIISQKEKITINDILIGEVWLAAGQSNMEMNFDYCCNSTDKTEIEVATANYNNIRMFNVKKRLSYEPTKDIKGKWTEAVGDKILPFSAVGYFFAKRIHDELNVPVGIIHTSWGGSRAEAWASHQVLKTMNSYKEELEKFENLIDLNQKSKNWFNNFESLPLPSSNMDLLLSEITKKHDIDYLSYYIDEWNKLDLILKNKIIDPNKIDWSNLNIVNSVDKAIQINNFSGLTLFKNNFKIKNLDENYYFNIKPENNMPWGLWEYDIYINGEKIASSLLGKNKEDYKYSKSITDYYIKPDYLVLGDNQIIVRVIGLSRLGNISIFSNEKSINKIIGQWEYKIIAEEFFQIENYQYPYTSLFFYNNKNIDFLKIPQRIIFNHQTIGSLFNGMLNPIIPYNIKGIIWYQGETNAEQGGPQFDNYKKLMPKMIKDWRNRWGYDFPFYYAQIAPYFNYNGMSPYFRDAQRSLLKVPNTGMVVTHDIGENYDIHPSNKHDVGERFARFALNNDYDKDIIFSGPLFKNSKIDSNKIILNFNHIGSGLVLNKSNHTFEISGQNKKYIKARVINKKNYLEIYSDKIENPVFVRYAWSDTSSAGLFNSEGLPASSFSTELQKYQNANSH